MYVLLVVHVFYHVKVGDVLVSVQYLFPTVLHSVRRLET